MMQIIINSLIHSKLCFELVSIFQKQSVYGPETSAFNNPNPKDPWIPNFIAFLYEKKENNNKNLGDNEVERIIYEIENFTISPSEKWNYSCEILTF